MLWWFSVAFTPVRKEGDVVQIEIDQQINWNKMLFRERMGAVSFVDDISILLIELVGYVFFIYSIDLCSLFLFNKENDAVATRTVFEKFICRCTTM